MTLRDDASVFLPRLTADPTADFHDGQWETIETLVERRSRVLVVQRTGWGKSAVYFVATRLLRDAGAGPTVLISPFLALMRNQLVMAERAGVRAVTINSENRDVWECIEADIAAGATCSSSHPSRSTTRGSVASCSRARRPRRHAGRGRSTLHQRLGSRVPPGCLPGGSTAD
jgi:superfamily II DNA helicase RecQ